MTLTAAQVQRLETLPFRRQVIILPLKPTTTRPWVCDNTLARQLDGTLTT